MTRTDPRLRIAGLAVALVVAGWLAPVAPVGAAADPPADGSARAEADEARAWQAKLDALREDLVQLRIEKVLADTDTWLRDPTLPGDARVEIWILRSQAHVALGDLSSAERDFEQILRLSPSYRPESSLMTPAASQRFQGVADRIVGRLRLDVTPADARVSLVGRDGERRAIAGPDGRIAVVAGENTVRVDRSGYDAWTETVSVEAGKEVYLQVQLVPNARTVTFRTSEPDVAVFVDGIEAGRTRFSDDAAAGASRIASLTVDDIPLGEHVFAFVKPCFRTVRRTESLNIDILDPVPLDLPAVQLEPAQASLRVEGMPAGARVTVDGAFVGAIPIEGTAVCPGTRVVEARVDGRVAYRAEVTVTDGVPVRLEVSPRPNVVLVGTETWPAGFDGMATRTNVLATLAIPERADLTDAAGWSRLALDADVDLALAVLPAERQGGAARWYLYSPLLATVERLSSPPADASRPAWSTNTVGFAVVDSAVGGKARVVHVRPQGPAAEAGLSPGDRILEIDGVAVVDATGVRERIARGDPGESLGLKVAGANGAIRELPLVGRPSASLRPPGDSPGEAALRAAWSRRWASSFPTAADDALANLALVFESADRDALAIETWGRVAWPDRTGIGAGTAAYHLGRVLLRARREADAIAAFRRAARSEATARDDDGPRLAPAAIDHLADLGVVPDADERPTTR